MPYVGPRAQVVGVGIQTTSAIPKFGATRHMQLTEHRGRAHESLGDVPTSAFGDACYLRNDEEFTVAPSKQRCCPMRVFDRYTMRCMQLPDQADETGKLAYQSRRIVKSTPRCCYHTSKRSLYTMCKLYKLLENHHTENHSSSYHA